MAAVVSMTRCRIRANLIRESIVLDDFVTLVRASESRSEVQ